jgi:preprotein translocase subunit YajC
MVLTAVPMASSGGGSAATFLLPLVLIVGLFWFMNRAQRKQRDRQQKVVAALRPGTRVLTSSGLAGTVEAIEDEFVVLEVAPGVSVRFVRPAIGQVLDDRETALGGNDADDASVDDAEEDADVSDAGTDVVTDVVEPDDKPRNPPTHTEH